MSYRIIAVSKTQSVAKMEEALSKGYLAFGENYLQEAISKIPLLNKKYSNIEWHFIGKIQKNKIKMLALYFDWVQTITSQEAAKKLNDAAKKLNKNIHVCIQVNSSHEPQKGGVQLEDILMLSRYIVENCPYLCLRGLMTIGLLTQDRVVLREMFMNVKQVYDSLRREYSTIDTLSMGMSQDQELAIECGSTMLRLGTAIFGPRKMNCE